MTTTRWIALPAVLAMLALALVACGGDDDDEPDVTETPDGAAPQTRLSDVEYLETMCIGLDEYAQAVETATEPEELADVLEQFIGRLEAVQPPEDVDEFHRDFIAYLREALDDPTRPLVTAPPLPPDDVRERLAAREPEVDACRNPTFFSE